QTQIFMLITGVRKHDWYKLVDTVDNGRQNFLITWDDSLSSLSETIKNGFEPKQHYRDWVYWLQKF
ncbi:MAG: hypothetical protein ACPG5T_09325, partial [Endozoicomonas sp.]